MKETFEHRPRLKRDTAIILLSIVCTLFVVLIAGILLFGPALFNNVPTATSVEYGHGYNSPMLNYDGAVKGEAFDTIEMESPTTISDEQTANLFEGQKLVKTVDIDVETKEWDTYISFVSEEVSRVGGYAEYSDYYTNADNTRWQSLTLRVPVNKLDDILTLLAERGNVIRQTSQIDNITLQYTDVEAQRDSLLVERERLMELLEMADTVEDLLAIEDRLTYVRYQLDNQERQLRIYDNQVEYATIKLDVQEVRTFTETNQSFWERVSDGMSNCWASFISFLEDACVYILSVLPVLVVVILPIAVIIILSVRHRRKKGIKTLPPDVDEYDDTQK